MIEQILSSVYGVGIVAANPITILWGLERIEDKSKARSELKRANRIRRKHGKPLVYPPFGHHAF